ncbi:MAG: hypothetical protein KDA93_02855 [Planctomycetaceae bacterium]|nr:hypothetical protein [Planctomycetaceae bacterium]
MANEDEKNQPAESELPADTADRRLYVIDGESWRAATKRGSERQYCYVQTPGDAYFHLILDGEIFLSNGDEQICLNCALRRGLLTTDRLHWQHRGRPSLPGT